MLRVGSVILVGAVCAAAAAPTGRVVRVERSRGMRTIPRLCDIQPSSKEGLCVGQPVANDRVTLIDQERGVMVGEFRIDSTGSAADPYVCDGSTPIVFRVKGVVTSGDADVLADTGRVVGLRGLPYDPKMRVIKDQRAPDASNERVELALDVDGDDRVDYMLVRYGCDNAGGRIANANQRLCFDTYLRRGGKLQKVHTDNIQICY